MQSIRSVKNSQLGSVLTEVAIVVPLLATLVLGIGSVSLSAFRTTALIDAVRAGARAGTIGQPDRCETARDTTIRALTNSGQDPKQFQIAVYTRRPPEAQSDGEMIFVELKYTDKSLLALNEPLTDPDARSVFPVSSINATVGLCPPN